MVLNLANLSESCGVRSESLGQAVAHNTTMALERPKAEPGRYLKELPTRGNQVKRIQREIGREDLKQRTGLASVEGRRR